MSSDLLPSPRWLIVYRMYLYARRGQLRRSMRLPCDKRQMDEISSGYRSRGFKVKVKIVEGAGS